MVNDFETNNFEINNFESAYRRGMPDHQKRASELRASAASIG